MIPTFITDAHTGVLPFRTKLTVTTMAVTAIALLVSCLGLIGTQYFYDRGSSDRQNRQLSEVLASNLGAALVFSDTKAAGSIINSARSVPNVVLIEIRDAAKHTFSRYEVPGLTSSERQASLFSAKTAGGEDGVGLGIGSYATPIVVGSDRVGTLIIGYRYRSLVSIAINTLPVALLLFLGCLAVANMVAQRLRAMAFQPLDRLSNSMREVRKQGDLSGRVASSNDPDFDAIITNYNAMLDEIEAHTAELSQAKDELEKARDQAEQASVAKSAFLANMSHELRTPLNAIIGYTEVLREDLIKSGMDRSIEDLGWIYSSSHQLLELINGLLDLSKIEAGRMDVDIHSFDLRRLLVEVEATLQPLAAKQGNTLTFTVEDDIDFIVSDSTKLRQALLNLCSNACKFTENGFVQVNTRYQGDEVIIVVADTGIGLTDEEIARLFQPFVQSDSSTTRRFGGTGLGLTLVKRFAELLKGTVSLASEPGFGSTFTLRIPRNLNGADPTAPAANAGAAVQSVVSTAGWERESGKLLALILEDEPSGIELLRRLLERNGYECLVARDGLTGFELARTRQPDLILLDISLPKLDGWGVLERIGKDDQLRRIPTIVVSVDDRKQLSIRMGASDHLTKPLTTDELESILRLYSHKHAERILLVEDDDETAGLYERGLSQCGFRVTRVASGPAAFDALDHNAFDLVVTDLTSPACGGYGLIAHLAAGSADRRLPLIVLSNNTIAPEHRSLIDNSVDSVLVKVGLTPRGLAARILEALND